jgi:hypothetical protein
MIGTLSQLVSLASAANGVIAGTFNLDTFYPNHADFKFCNSVRFVDVTTGFLGRPREVQRHSDPNDWLRSLSDAGVAHVWLTFMPSRTPVAPDHKLSAFVGGGGDWQLIAATTVNAEFWMSRWEVTKETAPDSHIWGVTYGCVGKSAHAVDVPKPGLNAASQRLLGALDAARAFAIQKDLQLWADWFQRAIDCCDATKSFCFPDYVNFVCLDSYPEMAQRLFAAAYNGWVFGGMGSWNDQYFETEPENAQYNSLSAELYAAINDGIQQASWSFGSK